MNAFVKIKGHAPFGQSLEGASLFCAADQFGKRRNAITWQAMRHATSLQLEAGCRRLAVIFLAASSTTPFENQY